MYDRVMCAKHITALDRSWVGLEALLAIHSHLVPSHRRNAPFINASADPSVEELNLPVEFERFTWTTSADRLRH